MGRYRADSGEAIGPMKPSGSPTGSGSRTGSARLASHPGRESLPYAGLGVVVATQVSSEKMVITHAFQLADILGLGHSVSSFGQTLALLITFLGIGVIANILIAYTVGQVLAERRQNQERQQALRDRPQ